ncbi:MAG: MYG1 family protein [Myxococcota bacterium]
MVTHPGGAHKDDLLGVSVLLALHDGVPVERREPTSAELDDAAVAVIDIGGRHEPQRLNFDHHHFPREHEPTCALSLVLDHLGLYREAKQLCDWLEPAEWFDSRGPVKTAAHLGVPRRAVAQLHSPVDVTLLRRFAASARLDKGDVLYDFMQLIGRDLLDYLQGAQQRMRDVEPHVERWTLPVDDGGAVAALFLPRGAPGADEPSHTLGMYARLRNLGPDLLTALVYPDRRGAGYGLARYEDHPGLDFSRVAGESDVTFAHKSGFMCKTGATKPERLKALLSLAWRRPQPS